MYLFQIVAAPLSWAFIVWTEALFYGITQKNNDLSENEWEIYCDKIHKVSFL